MTLFLGEAIVLAAVGGAAGLVLGLGLGVILSFAVPALPVQPAFLYIVLAEAIAVIIGVVAGVLPARRAAHLDPVEALRGE
jgi:putative ABC transport system permease protein